MATPQLSPGVLVREVDLTVGRADNVLDNIGAIAGPFRIGPVDDPIDITTEQELIATFGKPLSTDTQYEYWMSAANYLSYGGVLKVVRTGNTSDTLMVNANAGVGIASTTTLQINNYDDYQQISGQWIPMQISYEGQAKGETVQLEFAFRKAEINSEIRTPFSIPKSYTRL